ncbi:mitochondrial carrier [Auriculariales sp. MPI-PUGE-AT-0066]|nr:mitochondrial carrier [Auriculariales sp. MPI-PUGE-AT-0066]
MDGPSHGHRFISVELAERIKHNKPVVCATTASLFSTLAGYPLDSLKSRLQASRAAVSVPRMAATVLREEGLVGFFRGLWIPLFTISVVRATSFSIYNSTKDVLVQNGYFAQPRALDVGLRGCLGGATAGAIICFGSAPFELVKIRRQLEYSIAAAKGVHLEKPPSNWQAVTEIVRVAGVRGLYAGFPLHFLRDTSGTALYFWDVAADPRGPRPVRVRKLAGVTSWALIYPLDVVKTKVQQRALSGQKRRTIGETCMRMIRGPDPDKPRTFVHGIGRLYRGLGVSALRSVTTHGLLWTIFDYTGGVIDRL